MSNFVVRNNRTLVPCMKPLNSNKANLLLLFTRDPFVKLVNEELEYYSSKDDSLIGFVSFDKEDKTCHASRPRFKKQVLSRFYEIGF